MSMNWRNSKALGWSSMILMVVVIIISVATHVVSSIWEYSTLFFAFMAIFCHLMSMILSKMSMAASKKLEGAAGIFAVLAVISLIVVFIFNWIAF